MTTIEDLKAHAHRQDTMPLVIGLRTLDRMLKAVPRRPNTAALRLTRAVVIDELEARFPLAADAVEAAFEADARAIERGKNGPEIDYVAVLLAAIPADRLT